MSGLIDRLRRREPEEEYLPSQLFSVLDLGTEWTKVLVVQVDGERVNVLGTARARQDELCLRGGAITDIDGVTKVCDQVLRQAEDDTESATGTKVVPDAALLGVTGALVHSTLSTVEHNRVQPKRRVTRDEVEKIAQRVQRLAYNEMRERLSAESPLPERSYGLVDSTVVEVSINGQRLTNPLDYRGDTLTMTVFDTFAPLVHLGALETVCERLGLERAAIMTDPWAVGRCLGPHDENAIYVDVGSAATSVTIVHAKLVEATGSFALGGRAFTRRVAGSLGVPAAQAESTKLRYSAGELETGTANRLRDVLAADAQTWLDALEEVLSALTKGRPLPPRVRLCGGGANLPELPTALAGFDWKGRLPFGVTPAVDMISPKEAGVFDRTGSLTGPQDVAAACLASYAPQIGREEGSLDSLLEKVTSTMRMPG